MRRIGLFLIASLALISVLGSISSAETPRYGGTLITSNKADISTLNPVWKYDPSAYFVSQNIYSTVVISDYGVTAGHGPYGDLAKSWEVSDDGLTYTFHLHDNVYWHDGVKFSSADVKFTYDTAKEKKYPIAKYLGLVEEILAPDENTIVFKLSKVSAPFLPMFAQASNWYGQIIAKHLYEGTDVPNNSYNKKPVGTGPFKFDEWKPGQFLSVRANEKYFHRRPYLDKVIWRLYTNKEVAQADFRSGNIDMLTYQLIPPFHELSALAAQPGIKMWEQKSIYDRCIFFNHTQKPFNNIRVREAISLAINRDEVSQLAWAGLWPPNYHASCAGTPLFTNTNVRWPKRDVARAKQLLDEAGYRAGADGVRMRPTMIGTDYFKPMVEVIIQQLKGVGIQIKFELGDTATFFSRLRSGDFDLTPYYARFGPDPDAYREHFGSKGARNYGKYTSPAVDQLLEEGTKTLDFAKRKEMYGKVQDSLRKDLAYLPVTEAGYFEFSTSKLHGTAMGDPTSHGKSYGWAGYCAVWLEK